MRRSLENAVRNRGVVVATPTTIKSIMLVYIEALRRIHDSPAAAPDSEAAQGLKDMQKQVKELASMIKLFRCVENVKPQKERKSDRRLCGFVRELSIGKQETHPQTDQLWAMGQGWGDAAGRAYVVCLRSCKTRHEPSLWAGLDLRSSGNRAGYAASDFECDPGRICVQGVAEAAACDAPEPLVVPRTAEATAGRLGLHVAPTATAPRNPSPGSLRGEVACVPLRCSALMQRVVLTGGCDVHSGGCGCEVRGRCKAGCNRVGVDAHAGGTR
eukprot:1330621-Rhodomonas_salina.1